MPTILNSSVTLSQLTLTQKSSNKLLLMSKTPTNILFPKSNAFTGTFSAILIKFFCPNLFAGLTVKVKGTDLTPRKTLATVNYCGTALASPTTSESSHKVSASLLLRPPSLDTVLVKEVRTILVG
jgi:hypothetical protein